MANPEAALASLLDFNSPLDIALLDSLADQFFHTGDATINGVLSQFWQHELTWTRVDQIVSDSRSSYARLQALNVLADTIKTRWSAIPADHRAGIRNFVVDHILKISGDGEQYPPAEAQFRRQFLKSLNIALVQIAKNEWPAQWPSFIPDLVESSKTSQSICANNMQILLLLSEEIFDYSRGQMTSEKVYTLKNSLNAEFAQIFHLCEYVLDNSDNGALLTSTLQCLRCFLRWIPIEFIFNTKLLETLAVKFFPVGLFQNVTLQCLCEIAHLDLANKPEYDHLFVAMMTTVMEQVYKILPPEADIAEIYASGTDDVQTYLRHLALFITDFLRTHLRLMESASEESPRILLAALAILHRLTLIDDEENDVVIFSICLDYWNEFLRDVYRSERQAGQSASVLLVGPGALGGARRSDRLRFYDETLMTLRQVLISRMAKPEEVLVVVDEHGNAVRERLKNNGAIALYLSTREALVYLTNLDPDATMNTMKQQLAERVRSEWNATMLNRISWAIGSIAKALSETQEKVFLASVVHDLLLLVNETNKKDHKAIIAANIMYVVGQYPRFLKSHWSFLTTVIAKLFEFMHEHHPGVQDMACDTFLKVASRCKKTILNPPMPANGKLAPASFLGQLLEQLPLAIRDLQNTQIYTFYEAMSTIVAAETNPTTRNEYLQRLMTLPNQMWAQVTESIKADPNVLCQTATLDCIDMVLKTNTRVASAVKGGFLAQISCIYLEMLSIYEMCSSYVNQSIASEGPTIVNTAVIRKMLSVKAQTMHLLTTFVEHAVKREAAALVNEFLPQLEAPVIDDYTKSSPEGREAEVLTLCAAYIKTFQTAMVPRVPFIIGCTFPCTLGMIDKSFEDFPEHRLNLYRLLEVIVTETFSVILALSADEFKLVVDMVVWGIRHLDRQIQETGLNTLLLLLVNFQATQYATPFYSAYLVMLTEEVLKVLTDKFHKSGFSQQAQALITIVGIVDSNQIAAPLWDTTQAQFPTNAAFMRSHVGGLVASSFPNLNAGQVGQFVDNLFGLYRDPAAFKQMLRDFLIQIGEFAAHFSSEEAEAAAAAAKQREAEYVASVPGLEYQRGAQRDVAEDD